MLVDDGLVEKEKVGSLSLFWAFPSQARHLWTTRLAAVKAEEAELAGKLAATRAQLEEAGVDKEDTVRTRSVASRGQEEGLRRSGGRCWGRWGPRRGGWGS